MLTFWMEAGQCTVISGYIGIVCRSLRYSLIFFINIAFQWKVEVLSSKASPQLSPIHLRSPIQQALPYAAVPAQSALPS